MEVELPTFRSYVDTLEDYLFNYAFYHKSWEVCIMPSSHLQELSCVLRRIDILYLWPRFPRFSLDKGTTNEYRKASPRLPRYISIPKSRYE